jgi:energy-coupling factor transporter ATP-binding protein EcfA2
MADLMMETESLRRTFTCLVAVAGISLNVQHREIFGLPGPNGAGTTTIQMLTGQVDPSEAAPPWPVGMSSIGSVYYSAGSAGRRGSDPLCRPGAIVRIVKPLQELWGGGVSACAARRGLDAVGGVALRCNRRGRLPPRRRREAVSRGRRGPDPGEVSRSSRGVAGS